MSSELNPSLRSPLPEPLGGFAQIRGWRGSAYKRVERAAELGEELLPWTPVGASSWGRSFVTPPKKKKVERKKTTTMQQKR